ncbi:MAG: PLDc N-terminal domain-containing protein, partial [Gammaproteobacteria bacterium]|nr:PLDc N-terminal domain-containing protein [Gammaproteobacteria bacterium]
MDTGIVSLLLLAAHFSLAAAGAGHALLYKRDPRASITWMVVCLFIPFFGPISYYILGVNRVRTRAKAYRESRGLIGFERPERYSAISLKNIDALGPLATVGATISGHYLLPGNKVLPLQDAGKAYDAMLAAIDQAVHRVYLASYIFESDKTGQRFIDALVAAKKRNVEVK